MNAAQADPNDLLILGAGHLGGRVVALWRRTFADAHVLAETRSADRHAALVAHGATVRVRADEGPGAFVNVLVALPPSAQGGADEYAHEVRRTVQVYSGAGRLVMVSSTAVYAEQDGGACVCISGPDQPAAIYRMCGSG